MSEKLSVIEKQTSLYELEKENLLLNEKLCQYEMIFEQSLDAIFLLDQEGYFIEVNEAACQLFELPRNLLVGKSVSPFLVLESLHSLKQYQRLLNEHGSFKGDITIRTGHGKVKYIEVSVRKNTLNKVNVCIMRDVTSKKNLEKQRNISKQLFMDVYNRAVDGIVIFDRNGKFINSNQSFMTSFELTKEELVGCSIDDFVEEEFLYKLEKLWRILDEKERAQGELPVKLKSGARKIFEFTTTANIFDNYYMSIMRDVTEKKLMERKLQKSELRFREIFDTALDAIVIWNQDGRVLRANNSASKTFEMPLELLSNYKIFDFVDTESNEFIEMNKELIETGKVRAELDFLMVNGQVKRLEFTSRHKVLDGYNMTIFRNVSETRMMEKELRESEHKFRKLYDNALNGFIILDHDGHIVDMNPEAKRIFNVGENSSFLRKKFQDFAIYSELDKEQKWRDLLNNRHINGHFVLGHRNIEYTLSKNIIQDHHLAILHDVTERKAMEERLRKSDTLNVVGELAAGIAHEIRNPMTALKGFIQLLQGSEMQEDYAMYFEVITAELMRIETIITEFLILAKPQAVNYQQRDLIKIVSDTIDLLTPQAALENIQLEFTSLNEIPEIYCEPNQLKQVFINILKNGIEVMSNGGVISVTTSLEENQMVKISFKDQGTGIPKDKLKRLGEPFYTTKERGTGLGLMVSYKIIAEHNGKIEVESEEGQGTVFHIFLPIHPKN
ncbi:PAS domain S-box protein [Bacillus pinisoli]|uniref:PAS domain S-box protein n=1 Tax=Bacillus pinisoli TaxID=2901866 RepID=UPI001FF2060E|nr:PAS domain-containing sensor histidine kinase [Bacillus pinisoli]